MTSKLEQLKSMTTVVADTGDIEAIKKWQPIDATTNPSLLLKAAAMAQYKAHLYDAVSFASAVNTDSKSSLSLACDHLAVSIGREILQVIPGKISTEVDARLSFNQQATLDKARNLIEMYEDKGVSRERVLIKIASTWEGIAAAETLQKEGIDCNLTLLFSFEQALAAADAGVYLISPFVGRILDWYKSNSDKQDYLAHEDPGVISVSRIYQHYKACQYKTIVMGASFRNTGEIEALAGCDRLTISPDLLQQLDQDQGKLHKALNSNGETSSPLRRQSESEFRWNLNEDAMATEKLAEGIRKFAADQVKLESLLKAVGQ